MPSNYTVNFDNAEHRESAGPTNTCGSPPNLSEKPGFQKPKIRSGEFGNLYLVVLYRYLIRLLISR